MRSDKTEVPFILESSVEKGPQNAQEAQNQMISKGYQEIDPSLSVGITTWEFESFVI
jgi:hypothetical protein